MTKEELEALIHARFTSLPPKLKAAARYALDCPREIAMQSMRSVAASASLQPASMLRLARELEFTNYEAFRAVYMDWLSTYDGAFVQRAADLKRRSAAHGPEALLLDTLKTEVANLDRTLGEANAAAFRRAQELLGEAARIYILGLRSLFPAAYHLNYVCGLFCDNTTLMTGLGGTLADELRRIGAADVMVVFSFEPYASASVQAFEFAREHGARIIAVTDSSVSPVAIGADVVVLAPNASPSLLPSILPAMAAAQTLANLMLTAGGDDRLAEIANSEAQLRRFKVYAGR